MVLCYRMWARDAIWKDDAENWMRMRQLRGSGACELEYSCRPNCWLGVMAAWAMGTGRSTNNVLSGCLLRARKGEDRDEDGWRLLTQENRARGGCEAWSGELCGLTEACGQCGL